MSRIPCILACRKTVGCNAININKRNNYCTLCDENAEEYEEDDDYNLYKVTENKKEESSEPTPNSKSTERKTTDGKPTSTVTEVSETTSQTTTATTLVSTTTPTTVTTTMTTTSSPTTESTALPVMSATTESTTPLVTSPTTESTTLPVTSQSPIMTTLIPETTFALINDLWEDNYLLCFAAIFENRGPGVVYFSINGIYSKGERKCNVIKVVTAEGDRLMLELPQIAMVLIAKVNYGVEYKVCFTFQKTGGLVEYIVRHQANDQTGAVPLGYLISVVKMESVILANGCVPSESRVYSNEINQLHIWKGKFNQIDMLQRIEIGMMYFDGDDLVFKLPG